MTDLCRLTIDLRQHQLDRLDRIADATRIRRSELMRQGIDLVIDHHESKIEAEKIGREKMRGGR